MVCSKLQIIFFFLIRDALMLDTNDTSGYRKERVNGPILKLNSNKQNIVHCDNEGFLPDRKDCSIFYRCVKANSDKYTIFQFQCPPGTVFDTYRGICNYPQVAVYSGCTIPSENEEYDTKIKDTHSELPILNRDEDIDSYDKPNYNELSDDYLELPSQQVYPVTPSYNIPQIQSTKLTTRRPTPFVANEHGDNRCTTDGFMGDTIDCKKFYRCVNNLKGGYIRYEFKCNDATIWDDNIQGCNHAWQARNARCSKDNTYNNVLNDLNMSFGNKEKDHIPSQDHDDTPNYYNQPHNVPTPQDTTTDKNIKIDSTTQSEEPYSRPPLGLVQNKFECNSGGFYGDRNNCQNFYRCIETRQGVFTKLAYKCGDGTLWDASIEACNHAWAVKNCNVAAASSQMITDSPLLTTVFLIQTTTQPNNLLGHELDPSYPTHSDKKQPLTTTTTTIKTTSISDQSEHVGKVSSSNRCKEEGYFGNKEDCKKFYRCVYNGMDGLQIYEYNCGEGTIWDQDINSCNHPQDVKHLSCSTESYLSSTEQTTKKSSTISITNKPSYTSYYEPTTNKPSKPTGTSATSSTLQSTGDMICNADGFFGDPNDCKIFYRCVSDGNSQFINHRFECGEGTIWDQNIIACNHPQDVKNPSCSTETNVISTKPTSIMTSTIPSTYHETTTNKPIYSSYYEPTTNKPSNISTSPSTSAASSTLQSTGDMTCNTDGFFGDANDCQIFYRCVSDGDGQFIKHRFECVEGTIWDQDITACNHPQDVKNPSCSTESNVISTEQTTTISSTILMTDKPSYTSYHEPTTNKPSYTSTTISTSATSSTLQSTGDMICNTDGFFGDANNCQVFYRCVSDGNGQYIKHKFTCGEGTIWDQDITACNHPQDVKNPSCSTESNVISTQPTSTIASSHHEPTTNKPSYTSTSTSTSAISSTMQSMGDMICNNDGFFGDANDCQVFYRCVSDGNDQYIKHKFTCGEGTIWDQDITACNHPQDVKNPSCSSNQPIPSGETPYPEKESDDTSTTTKISTTSSTISNTEITTTTSPTTVKTSTSTATSSSPSTPLSSTSTTQSYEVDTNKNKTSEKGEEKGNLTCTEAGFYPNPNDCKKFYRCVDWYNNGTSFSIFHFECGEGTIWDPSLDTCNYEDAVFPPRNCSGSSTQPQNNPESTSSESGYDTSSTSTPESNNVENNENQTSSEGQEKTNFTCTEAGFYPNPNDCKKFYRCVDWYNNGTSFSIFHFECGEGTIWDPSLDTCNYEDAVFPPRNCTGSSSQAQSNTENTTSESSTIDTTTTQGTTAMTTSEPTTKSTEESSSTSTTEQISSTKTSTTTEQQTSTTAKSTTQTETSSTEQSTTTTTESTTSERSTTAMDQTDRTTEQQSSSTEQQSSSTEQQSSSTEQQSSSTEQQSSSTEQQSSSTEQQSSSTEQQSSSTEQQTSSTEQQSSSTEQQTTSTTESSSESTETTKTTTEATTESTTSSTPKDKCPDMEDDQYAYVCPTSFRRHPKYCNLFYQCTEDEDSHDVKIALFHCPNNTIYDESKTQCLDENKASKKCEGSLAQSRRIKRLSNDYIEPITVSSKSYACSRVGYFPFEKNVDCSQAILKCQRSNNNKLAGYVFKCAEGYTFWSKSKRCERTSRVKDCKRSIYPWNKRHDIPTETHNISLY